MSHCGSVQNFEAPTEFSTTNENDVRDCASSAAVAKNIAPNTLGERENKKEKEGNPTRRIQKEAIPTFLPSKPRHFVGFYVCKEYNGARILGTVVSCNYKKNLLRVEYDDNRMEYLEQSEVLKNAAKNEDILEAKQALLQRNNSQKTAAVKRKRTTTTTQEGSNTRKRRKISSKKKVPIHASRIMPSNSC